MAGRGPQTFRKRQKEQQRKEKQQEKAARRLQRAENRANGIIEPDDPDDDYMMDLDSDVNPLDSELLQKC